MDPISRLVADVVTGQVDVQAVAASLPEEADEPETLDETAETKRLSEKKCRAMGMGEGSRRIPREHACSRVKRHDSA